MQQTAISIDTTATSLFDPVRLGPLTLANRIVMAPLTRSRATSDGVPSPLAAEYYAQRASAGLLIAEATNISPQGRGYAWTPGIYSDVQVQAWSVVTNAVHGHCGRIFDQLWHVGRISHPDLQPGHALPVAPSAIAAQGQTYTEDGFRSFVVPRALETDEIPGIVEQYRHAARCARQAGFDGVEMSIGPAKGTPNRRPKGTPFMMWICRAAVCPAAVGEGVHSSAGAPVGWWWLEAVRRGF